MVKRGFEIPHRMGKVPFIKNDSGYGGHSAWRSRSAAGQQGISKQPSKAFGGRSPLTPRSNMSHLIVSPVTSGAPAAPFLEGLSEFLTQLPAPRNMHKRAHLVSGGYRRSFADIARGNLIDASHSHQSHIDDHLFLKQFEYAH